MDVDRYDMLPGERSDEQREHDNVLQKYRDADNARLAAEQAEAQRKQASEAAAGRWTAKPTAAQLLKKSMKATAMASALSFNTTAAAAAARKAERGMFAGAKYGRMQPGLMEGHGRQSLAGETMRVYSGEFKDGERHGKGREYDNGALFYVGDFFRDERHGEGMSYRPDRTMIYEGGWRNGLPGGRRGLRYYAERSGEGNQFIAYDGEWLRGQQHGSGKGYAPPRDLDGDGDTDLQGRVIYDGEWKHGMRHGHGQQFYARQDLILQGRNLQYEGEWAEGKRHAKGKVYDEVDRTDAGISGGGGGGGDTPPGDDGGGKLQGQGKEFYLNGDTYEGDWKEGRRWGSGVYTFASGAEWVGQWVDNMMHGKGFMKFADPNTGKLDGSSRVISYNEGKLVRHNLDGSSATARPASAEHKVDAATARLREIDRALEQERRGAQGGGRKRGPTMAAAGIGARHNLDGSQSMRAMAQQHEGGISREQERRIEPLGEDTSFTVAEDENEEGGEGEEEGEEDAFDASAAMSSTRNFGREGHVFDDSPLGSGY